LGEGGTDKRKKNSGGRGHWVFVGHTGKGRGLSKKQ